MPSQVEGDRYADHPKCEQPGSQVTGTKTQHKYGENEIDDTETKIQHRLPCRTGAMRSLCRVAGKLREHTVRGSPAVQRPVNIGVGRRDCWKKPQQQPADRT